MKLYTPIIFLFIPIIHFGQNWDFEQKMVASDRDQNAWFGYSLALQNDQILSGAYREDYDENGQNFDEDAGAIYYFKKNANGVWTQRQKILAIDRETGDSDAFGITLDIDQTDLISGSGSKVYTYNYNGATDSWDDGSILYIDLNGNNRRFPIGSNAIDGDTFILGYQTGTTSPSSSSGAGAVVIFDKDTSGQWVESQIIEPSIAESTDEFGLFSDIDGDYIVVGAPSSELDNQGNPSGVITPGAVFIFERNSMGIWNEIQRITAPIQTTLAQFGRGVKLDGSRLVIGTNLENAAYIYERDSSGNWNLEQRIQGPSGSRSFSRSFDIKGQFMILGAGTSDNGTGAAYVYELENGTWILRERLVPPVRSPGDNFGFPFNSISYQDGSVVIGANLEDHDLNENNFIQSSGSIYTFTFNGTLSEQTASLDQVKIYPNPVADYLNFSNIPSTSSQLEIDIYNYLGQKVHREVLNNQKVDVSLLPTGIYIIEVTDSSQKQVFKVIKQ